MANTVQARKRARQSENHRLHNMALRSRFRTVIKKILKAVKAGDKEGASGAFKAAVPVIDTMVNKGIIHRNKAARHKSRLNQQLKVLSASQ